MYAQQYDRRGRPLGQNFRVNQDEGLKFQGFPSVSMTDSTIFVAWQDTRLQEHGNDIFAKVFVWGEESVEEENEPGIARSFTLLRGYPNPFNERTLIKYALPNSGDAHIAVYNLLGQRVKTLVDASQETGRYEITWDGRDQGGREVASGVYFCRMRAKGLERTIKMALVK